MDEMPQTPARPIRFGTSGWRGLVGQDVTFPALYALCHAVARWALEQDAGRRIVLGFDTRLMSERMARTASAVLQQGGCQVLVSHQPIPTPVLTRAIATHEAAAGVMITASHNPPEYHGVKVFGAWGGSVGDEDARRIESLAAEAPAQPGEPVEIWTLGGTDFLARYRSDFLSLLDRDALAAAKFRVVYDAMHGVGAGVLDELLRETGLEVDLLRGTLDAGFGGASPDPVAENLKQLCRSVKRTVGPCLGLATDGDADRFAIVEPGGRLLSETQSLALLVDHLARTGRIHSGVALGSATGSLVAKVAESHGLTVQRRPIGFKHLSLTLVSGHADVAGDESGGFALAQMGTDKDGILAGALAAELMAANPGGIGARLRGFEHSFGRSACGRRALPASGAIRAALVALQEAPPDTLGTDRVKGIDLAEGLRLAFDDGFVLCRTSGTEPRVRVYAEASGPSALRERLDQAVSMLEKHAPASHD